MSRLIRALSLTLALAALASTSAIAVAPNGYSQPVAGSAVAVTSNPGGCVEVGDSVNVGFTLWNMTDQTKAVNIFIYNVGSIDTPEGKVQLMDVDTAASGLTATGDSTVWVWRIKLRPKQSVSHTLYVRNVAPGYYPTDWNSNWGPAPWPSLYIGGQALVRYSRSQVSLSAQIPYCSLKGSIPYTTSPPPAGGGKGGGK